jgi:hypothetical protein
VRDLLIENLKLWAEWGSVAFWLYPSPVASAMQHAFLRLQSAEVDVRAGTLDQALEIDSFS